MFTPLSLRTFISPTPNHMNLGQQALANVGSLVAAQHQQPHQPMPPTQQSPAQTRHHQAANGLPPTTNNNHTLQSHANQSQLNAINLNVGCVPLRQSSVNPNGGAMMIPVQKVHKFHLNSYIPTPLTFSTTPTFCFAAHKTLSRIETQSGCVCAESMKQFCNFTL